MNKKSIYYFITIMYLFISVFSTVAFADVQSALSQADPVIQVIEYEISEGSVELDSEFTIKVTIKNNNAYSTAYNVTARVNTPDMDFHLVDGQVSQTYFQSIAPNQTATFEQTFCIEKSFPYKSAFLEYTFNYSDNNGNVYTNSTSLSPKVTIPCKLKINVLSVASKATLGSRSLINVRCTNDGTTDISNITMNLNGEILETQNSIDLGSLKAGEQLMQDCYVNFTKSGQQSLGISFTYSDEQGNTYNISENTYAVSVSTEKLASVDSITSSGNSNSSHSRIRIFIIVIIIVAVIIYIKKKPINTKKKGR